LQHNFKVLKLSEISYPIAAELKTFEAAFKAQMQSSVPLLDKVTQYIYKRKGKQMRPMFVFFTAQLCGAITPATHRGAALVELLHTATLVHDDVVDDAYLRRGFLSINAVWKNKIAVLVGDFLLAKGLLLSLNNDDFNLLKIVSRAVQQMSEGELLQIEKARRLDIKEDVYYEIIRQKTASLIASCCACGAASAGVEQQMVDQLHLFGEHVGMAFQIKDDLMDFGYDDIGKPKGIDIKEKKLTLPLIYALQKVSTAEKNKMIKLVKNHHEEKKTFTIILNFINAQGGMDYAAQKMMEYKHKAIAILAEFPDSSAKESLIQLVDFTINRKK
jgi:octaprenyl-diphosphate synthase